MPFRYDPPRTRFDVAGAIELDDVEDVRSALELAGMDARTFGSSELAPRARPSADSTSA